MVETINEIISPLLAFLIEQIVTPPVILYIVFLAVSVIYFLICLIDKEKNKKVLKIISLKVFSSYMVNYTLVILGYFSLILIFQTLIGFFSEISIMYGINCSILSSFFYYISVYLILVPFYGFMLYGNKLKNKNFNSRLYLYKMGVFLLLRFILLLFFPLEYREIVNFGLFSLFLYSFWGEIFLYLFKGSISFFFPQFNTPIYCCTGNPEDWDWGDEANWKDNYLKSDQQVFREAFGEGFEKEVEEAKLRPNSTRSLADLPVEPSTANPPVEFSPAQPKQSWKEYVANNFSIKQCQIKDNVLTIKDRKIETINIVNRTDSHFGGDGNSFAIKVVPLPQDVLFPLTTLLSHSHILSNLQAYGIVQLGDNPENLYLMKLSKINFLTSQDNSLTSEVTVFHAKKTSRNFPDLIPVNPGVGDFKQSHIQEVGTITLKNYKLFNGIYIIDTKNNNIVEIPFDPGNPMHWNKEIRIKNGTNYVVLGRFKPCFLRPEAFLGNNLKTGSGEYHSFLRQGYNLKELMGENFLKERYKIGVFKKQL